MPVCVRMLLFVLSVPLCSPLSNYPRIQSIDSRVDILMSKRRPRKICIIGSDGREYKFLVKGHEDLRQDERVIQVCVFNVRLSIDCNFPSAIYIEML